MKKIYSVFAVIFFSLFSAGTLFSQVPAWAWACGAGGLGFSDYASSVAVDAAGNVYAAGYFGSNTITFGTTVLVNVAFEDLFIVKYDPNGNVLWARSAGGDYTEEVRTLAVDASGNLVVAGIFASSTLTFGTTTLVNAGNTDLFIAKYDPAGNVLWAKSAGGYSGDYSTGVVADLSDNIFLTGYFSSPSITFDSITMTNQGLFMVKYGPGGNVIWAKGSEGTQSILPDGIATDAAGNCYASGEYWNDTLIFSPVVLKNTNGNNGDIFLVKYDAGGNVLWAKSTGGFGIDYGQAIAADAAGNVYFGGTFHSSWILFDSIKLTNPDSAVNTGFFIAKYDAGGNVLWASKAGAQYDDQVSSVAVDSSGNCYLAGNFNCDTLDFGPVKLANTVPYYTDIFIAKYDAGGIVQWATHASGVENEDTYCITADPAGNVYVVGGYKGTSVTFGTTTLINLGWWDLFVAKLGSTNVGIHPPDNPASIAVFPNPATDILNVNLPQKSELEILTIEGQIVRTFNSETQMTTINIQSLSNGLYLLKATTGNEVVIRKFIKQ